MRSQFRAWSNLPPPGQRSATHATDAAIARRAMLATRALANAAAVPPDITSPAGRLADALERELDRKEPELVR
jgi:hypothetical protein